MFGLFLILALVGSGWCVDRQGSHPFVQSKTDFTYVRLLLQDLVPHDTNNLTVHSARVHLSGGVLAAVTSAVGKSVEPVGAPYDPLSVLQKVVPAVWEDYNGVAADPLNNKLAEVNAKILPVTSLMDALCPGSDVETCNAVVEDTVKNNGFLQNRANLLLSAGRVSRRLKKYEKEVLAAVENYSDLPSLVKAMETKEYEDLAYDLADLDRRLDHHLV